MENGTTTIEVKLLKSGQYLWTISRTFDNESTTDDIKTIKMFDIQMKQEFPDYARRGSGRVAAIEDDE